MPVLGPKDAANRYPDLVILREEHLALTQKRLTITREMPPPRLVVEVVSPGRANREGDYEHKHRQYAALSIPEYWIIDPELATITIFQLAEMGYQEVSVLQGEMPIVSPEFGDLGLTAAQILQG